MLASGQNGTQSLDSGYNRYIGIDAALPKTASCDGAIAQLGERLNGIQEVRGSTPLGSTSKINDLVEPPNLSSHLLVIDWVKCAAWRSL